MNIKEAYNSWASQYDTNENKTRDLEALSLRETLGIIDFEHCLEVGCGTGKNTAWLLTRAKQITAVDLSEKMLARAQARITAEQVKFIQADITKEWSFATGPFDLVTFSLVLEHIEHLDAIFNKLAGVVSNNGYVYIGELHPFKQYSGSKARFETEEGLKVVTCFNHHVSDFTHAAKANGFEVAAIEEYFDGNDRTTLPRILTLLFKKQVG